MYSSQLKIKVLCLNKILKSNLNNILKKQEYCSQIEKKIFLQQ